MFNRLLSWFGNKQVKKYLLTREALSIAVEANEALTNMIGMYNTKLKGLNDEILLLLGAITLQFSSLDTSIIVVKREMLEAMRNNSIITNIEQTKDGNVKISLTRIKEKQEENKEDNDKQ